MESLLEKRDRGINFELQPPPKILQVVPVILLKNKVQKSIQKLVTAAPSPLLLVETRAVVEPPLKMVEAGMVMKYPLNMVKAGMVVENPLLLNPPLLRAVHLAQLMEKSNTTHPSPPLTRRARAGQAGNHWKAGTRDADPREGRV